MKSNASEQLNDIANAAASRRSKVGFRLLLVVAVLLAAVAAAFVWNSSLGLSAHDISSLFDESDVISADDGPHLILVIVRDSPEARKLLAGPESIEIGGYLLSRTYEYPTPAQPEDSVRYSSRGTAHWISMTIKQTGDSEVTITVLQSVGLSKLFGWGNEVVLQ